MPTPYEKERLANLKRNRELLLALELDELKNYVPSKTKKVALPEAKSRKRKSPPPRDAKNEDESDGKVLKTRAAQDITNTSGIRRSARNAGKVVDYKSEVVKAAPEIISPAARIAANSESKKDTGRRHSPYVNSQVSCYISVNGVVPHRKQYGDIPGTEVGQWWPTRWVAFKLL